MRLFHYVTVLALALLVGGAGLTASSDASAGPAEKKLRKRAQKKVNKAHEKAKDLRQTRRKLKKRHRALKEVHEKKKARHSELKDKETAGSLTDEEKAEMERMEKNRAKRLARRDKLKTRYKKKKTELKVSRRRARRAVLTAWGATYARPAVRVELKKHARRMAYLRRARHVAEAEGRDKLAAHIQKLIDKEKTRHQRRAAVLRKG